MEKNTEGFKPVEDAFCVLWVKGSLKQSNLFSRKSEGNDNPTLYAKYGSGFIAIYSNGSTSSANIQCKGINCKGVIWKNDVFGMLEVQNES